MVWHSMNIHRIQIKSMFESTDDSIGESHFWIVAVTDFRALSVMAKLNFLSTK